MHKITEKILNQIYYIPVTFFATELHKIKLIGLDYINKIQGFQVISLKKILKSSKEKKIRSSDIEKASAANL